MASPLDEYFGDGDEMQEEDEYIDAWPDGPPDEGLGSRCPVGDVSAASGANSLVLPFAGGADSGSGGMVNSGSLASGYGVVARATQDEALSRVPGSPVRGPKSSPTGAGCCSSPSSASSSGASAVGSSGPSESARRPARLVRLRGKSKPPLPWLCAAVERKHYGSACALVQRQCPGFIMKGSNRGPLHTMLAVSRLVAKRQGAAFSRASDAALREKFRKMNLMQRRTAIAEYLYESRAALLGDAEMAELRPSGDDEGSDGSIRARGLLLTWNGSWLLNVDVLQELAAQALPLDVYQSILKRQPEVEDLWKQFISFANEACKEERISQMSACMEMSTEAGTNGRVHFHAYLSNGGQKFRAGSHQRWAFCGSKPFPSAYDTDGSVRRSAVPRGHYYCQVPKKGCLFMFTNYPAVQHFVIEPRWLVHLWAQQKITRSDYVAELLRSRMRVRGIIAELEWQERRGHYERLLAESRKIQAAVAKQQCPFRKIGAVEKWKAQYPVFNPGKVVPLQSRYKFLVLNGPSRKGKSEYARSLCTRSLVVECANVEEPRLQEFSREKHSLVVFEEASWRMVLKNRALFQSGVNVLWLCQSRCQEHAVPVLLHGIALVVCCNDWLEDAKPGEEDMVNWCEANSVVVQVTEPLWEEPCVSHGSSGPATQNWG